jgi:hypothetical protein
MRRRIIVDLIKSPAEVMRSDQSSLWLSIAATGRRACWERSKVRVVLTGGGVIIIMSIHVWVFDIFS